MTRYAKRSTLFKVIEPFDFTTHAGGMERCHLFLTTDDEGVTWQVREHRSSSSSLGVSLAGKELLSSCPTYPNAERLFDETVAKIKRDECMVDSDELHEIPDGWKPINAPTRTAITTDPRLTALVEDPAWVMIPLQTREWGRLEVRGRHITFNGESLANQKLADDLYSKVGGDFAISAGTDDYTQFVAFDLIEEMCLSKTADFDERLAILTELLDNVDKLSVVPYVSDANAKRAIAHAYAQGEIRNLILRTRCPIVELTEQDPATQISFKA